MALIILLMLSEDEAFAKSIHEIVVPFQELNWYKERTLTNCTLGSLIFLVLTRTIHYNMSKLRDQYLHTNCIATLGNLANRLQNLHPYVCQRFMVLFQMLVKRCLSVGVDENFVVRGILKEILSVMSVTLGSNLNGNVQFVFSILHKKDSFLDLVEALKVQETVAKQADTKTPETGTSTMVTSANSVFEEDDVSEDDDEEELVSASSLLNNKGLKQCLALIEFYDKKIEDITKNDSMVMSAENVCGLIQRTLRVFPRSHFGNMSSNELKFSYMEEENPEEFFIPYVWHMTYSSCQIYWKPDAIRLFTLAM